MGQQASSLKHMKRFSMCSCLTVYFPDTYTVHGVSVDVMNKGAAPGKRILQPHADLWEPHWGPRTLKIPATVDTFLYSPYAEAISDSFRYPGFDNGRVRYVNGSVGTALEQQGLAWRYPQPSAEEHKEELRLLEKKVDEMWGPNLTKILVLYNLDRAEDHDVERINHQRTVTRQVFRSWPIVQVKLTHGEPVRGEAKWNGWEHYNNATRAELLKEVERIEARR